jgi:hypothetical protein
MQNLDNWLLLWVVDSAQWRCAEPTLLEIMTLHSGTGSWQLCMESLYASLHALCRLCRLSRGVSLTLCHAVFWLTLSFPAKC